MGYPNRGTLAQWLRDQFPDGISGKGNSCRCGKTHVRLTQEQKLEAIQRVIVCHEPEYKVASEYGVSKASISKWKRQFLGKDALPMKKCQVPVDTTDLPDSTEALHTEIKHLKKEIEDLRMERDALEMAAKLLKKAEGIDLKSLKNKEKADVIDALRKYYQLKNLLSLFRLSKSGYFYLKCASRLPDKYKNTKEKVKTIFHDNYDCFGYRRLHLLLKRQGITVSEKVVRRIMHEESLCVCRKRQHKYSSYLGEISPAVPNLLKRDFHADRPNQKWLTDLSEFALPAGKVYLSPVIDCFDGMVVHWTIGTSPNAELANSMLDGAIAKLKEHQHPIVHSDRGGHYRWPGWITRMDHAGLIRSMSKKGCSPDNSACEGFFGRLKNEMFYGRSWANVSLNQFMKYLDQYLHWYNERRIKSSLGGLSPVEYRRKLGLTI